MCTHAVDGGTIEAKVTHVTGYKRGHHIIWKDGEWEYEDGEVPIDEERPCVKCGEMPTEKGHDPCIAGLPGVENACCGHGVQRGYVSFENGTTIRGRFTKVRRKGGSNINFNHDG